MLAYLGLSAYLSSIHLSVCLSTYLCHPSTYLPSMPSPSTSVTV